MYELIVRKSQDEVFRHKIMQETLTIGRSSDNDICLPDPQISRTHLIIQQDKETLTVTDKSTNGSFLNGSKMLTENFGPKDKLKIGAWTLSVEQIDEEGEEDNTQIIHMGPTQVMSYKPAENKIVYQDASLKDSLSGKKYTIDRSFFTIGSAEGNDLIIDEPHVSSFHAKIFQDNQGFKIRDLDSTNGTFIDQRQVTEVNLSPGTRIVFGKQPFVFECQHEDEWIEPSESNEFEGMISKNPNMRQNFALVEKVSKSSMAVLIQGPTGSGKELMAKAIHNRSVRAKQPYITLNCGAIPKDLIESELFGHERGAFTSAHQQRKGVFEEAHGGTLFLDEIGELPIDLQAKLLRALEYGEIRRLGSSQTIRVDVRIIAATHRNLPQEIVEGRFREDLYYRLYMIPISIPALADRKEDIAPLSHFFIEQQATKTGEKYQLDPGIIKKLEEHQWPGNIRELKNVLGRAMLQCEGEQIRWEDVQFAPASAAIKTAFEHSLEPSEPKKPQTLRDLEKAKIQNELDRYRWNKKETAESLGIAKSTLHEKIKKYGLSKDSDK